MSVIEDAYGKIVNVLPSFAAHGWPFLVDYIFQNTRTRTIHGYYIPDDSTRNIRHKLVAWEDERKKLNNFSGLCHGVNDGYCLHTDQAHKINAGRIEFHESILSSEMAAALKYPPLSLNDKEVVAVREILSEMGLIDTYLFRTESRCCITYRPSRNQKVKDCKVDIEPDLPHSVISFRKSQKAPPPPSDKDEKVAL
jgi:hypothetical protein